MKKNVNKKTIRIVNRIVFSLVMLTAFCLVSVLSFYITKRMIMTYGSPTAQIINPDIIDNDSILGTINEFSGTPEMQFNASSPTLTPWDGIGRVSVLLLGLDQRDWSGGEKYSRSDTMILLTIDPLNRTVGILSIPRDLWVSIPGFKHGKINTAHYLGDAYKLPGGGTGLAVKTVEQFLGVPINYYAQIDFSAFVKFIDEIGGVKVNVSEKITIDLLGSGAATKKTLEPGLQVLPGEWALAYSRARNTRGGDFDRAERQQQVVLGIRDRILSLNMLPALIGKSDVLYQQLSEGIETNIDLMTVIKLASLASQIRSEDINRGVIGEEYVLFGRSPDNLSILIPLIDKIQILRDEIFATTGALSPFTSGDTRDRMLQEGARVSLQNKSNTALLGEHTGEYLKSLGVTIVQAQDVEGSSSLTTLISHTGKPFTTDFLVEQLSISPLQIIYEPNPASATDIEIILGDDWGRSNRLP